MDSDGIRRPRTVVAMWSALVLAGVLCSLPAGSQTKDPLLFPKDRFTVKQRTVHTSAGERKVTYRAYLHIPYVALPVDKEYQSLNVYAPVSVDGVEVDPMHAPILFSIGVGGYMSCSVTRQEMDRSTRSAAPPPAGAPQPRAGVRPKVSNVELALAAGYVVITVACRGRDNRAADGTYYGKAPAAIVDLKAAVRYLRHNQGIVPGNTEWIVSTGVSAGGALSALLGASGDSPLYEPYLQEIGAAKGDDRIFASACYCPITDLEHADGAYEWMYGTTPRSGGRVDQTLSRELRALYASYQPSLGLQGRNGFGLLTAENYDRYLLHEYLIPSAERTLRALSEADRRSYLAKNTWIDWNEYGPVFSFRDYVAHVGRMKGVPAFDDLAMSQPEPILFGTRTVNARHFTEFSLRHATGSVAGIDPALQKLVEMMNAMTFIRRKHSGCVHYWWLRQGSSDNHTSLTVMANLAVSLENQGKAVDAWLYWDGGHGANEDGEQFMAWIGEITGHGKGDHPGK
ncbi:MAG: hypothetical protein IPI01_12695 [Ignavibacteriae bacterium]|nr:hypothetical protein [Ignavibacteriota bacterium]